MKLLYEDSEILVCIKPVGVLSQADSEGRENMIDLLSSHTGGEIYPLHRLDREVGGVMVYAKTKSAAAKLSRDISEGSFKKEYTALVHGKPRVAVGEMRDLLFKDSRKNKSFTVTRMRKGVKSAYLEYELSETFNVNGEEYSAVKVLLHTGRTHQIRVQFSSRQMPLAGDKRYGAKDGFKNICLWSYRITFRHPVTNELMCFSEPRDWYRQLHSFA